MAWRFVLDGTDITSTAFDKQVTRRLNRPASARCRIPSRNATVQPGTSRLKVYDDSNALFFHGIVWHLEDEGDTDVCYTKILAYDPMVLWRMRPARDADGDFSYPSFLTTQVSGPQIMKYLLDNSITWEGSLFLDTSGVVETGGADLSGTPVDYPMTVADVWSLLADTGMVDVVLEPVDVGGQIARASFYNGDFGDDLSGSVAFQYGMGAYNVRQVRRTQDMSTMCNKLYYYLGPRLSDINNLEFALQHWRTNVTTDHPALANPPGGSITNNTPLGLALAASRSDYWVSMDVRIFDSAVDSGTDAEDAQLGTDALFLRLWQQEMIARVRGRTMAHLTPIRGLEPAFDIGDLVSVQAGSVLRGGFTGAQKVHEFTVTVDNDGVTDLGELVVSADQESL